MTTTWTPQNIAERSWVDKLVTPQPGTGTGFKVVDAYIVVPRIAPASAKQQASHDPYQVLDVSGNVIDGRQPYTFSIFSSTFPPGSVDIEPNGRFLYGFAGAGSLDNSYSAVIQARDANNAIVFFAVNMTDAGDGVFTLSGMVAGRIPDAHFGVPFAWQIIASGGVPPYYLRFRGLNLNAFGFTWDETTGLLLGTQNVHTNSDNLVLISGWDSTTDSGQPAMATLGGNWKFNDP